MTLLITTYAHYSFVANKCKATHIVQLLIREEHVTPTSLDRVVSILLREYGI